MPAALVTGLASANIGIDRKNESITHTQKLDTNDDGAIGLDELTAHQDRRFAKLDRDENRMIEKHEFNARLIKMFRRMALNEDGVLRDDEFLGHRYNSKQHQHSDKASDPTENSLHVTRRRLLDPRYLSD